MRTKEEIEAEIKKGEEFVKQHPFSMFGDDNKKGFDLFKRIVGLYQKGKTLDEIERLIEDAYGDEEYSKAMDVLSWLRKDLDEDFF